MFGFYASFMTALWLSAKFFCVRENRERIKLYSFADEKNLPRVPSITLYNEVYMYYRVYDVSQAALKFSPICIRHRVCVHTGKEHSIVDYMRET